MVELDPDELAMLKRAKAAPLAITVKDRGMAIPAAFAERRLAERLTTRGHLQFEGFADDKAGYEIALYRLTSHGRCVLDVVAGRISIDADDLAHPGCG